MMVFIDSTEFLNDPYAMKMKWNRLGDWLDCDRVIAIVPQIVLDEASRQFRLSLKEVGRNLDRCLRRMHKLLPDGNWSLPAIQTDGAEDDYRAALSKRLSRLRVEQPDHNGSVLVTCSGRSTKAAIVSQILLKYLSETNEPVVIVSDNTRDFGTPGKTSAEFTQELEQSGIPIDRVQIYRTLFEFVKKSVIPRLRKRNGIIEAINDGTHPFNSNQLFADRHDEILQSISDFIEPWGDFPGHFNTPEFGSPHLEQLSTIPEHFQIESLDMDGSQIIMFVRYWVDGIVACKYKATDDYHSGRVSFDFHASVLLNMETGEVDDFEIGEDFAYSLWPEEWPTCGQHDETETE